MTTPLVRPLTREILVSGTAYRVMMTADRLTLTPKGRRKGAVEVTWDEILSWREQGGRSPEIPATASGAVPPKSVLSEVARDLVSAAAAIARADETLTQAGALPPELRAELSTDPYYGRPEIRDDWFIEPLLTEREVASVLRVSTRAVRRLPLRYILIGGETRFRQSEIRSFLQRQESKNARLV
ncbi:MAG TPA: helix-turn-helix domain-containing protein [Gemmatimonadaceae bacterium]|nr:helix-turn-helix domain-containing protein [Gemmatimonadaceae bacterium]